MAITGTMLCDLQMLGTGLKLKEGERVLLEPATNLPKSSPLKWYAMPLNGRWSNGLPCSGSVSIAIEDDEVEIDKISSGSSTESSPQHQAI